MTSPTSKKVSLYNDTVHILFNENARNRYVIEETGTSPVGVTTVLGALNKPALMTWPMYEAITYIKTVVGPLTEEHLELAGKAYLRKSDTGKETGTTIHKAVESILNGEEPVVPPEAVKAVTAFRGWLDEVKPKMLATEQIVYSRINDFCGTYDCLLEIDGKVVLADLKTSNASRSAPLGIYPETFLQLGAYYLAHREENSLETIDDLLVLRVGKDGVVNTLRASEVGLTPIECSMTFLSVLDAYRFMTPLTKKLKEMK